MNCHICGEEIREPAGYVCGECLEEKAGIKTVPEKKGMMKLSPREAIIAMLDGAILVDKNGTEVRWNDAEHTMVDALTNQPYFCFANLHYKKTRPMTRIEILEWVQSPESRGWLVNIRLKGYPDFEDDWQLPTYYKYDNYEGSADDIYEYVRAPILPNKYGVDKNRLCKFEVEVEQESNEARDKGG